MGTKSGTFHRLKIRLKPTQVGPTSNGVSAPNESQFWICFVKKLRDCWPLLALQVVVVECAVRTQQEGNRLNNVGTAKSSISKTVIWTVAHVMADVHNKSFYKEMKKKKNMTPS